MDICLIMDNPETPHHPVIAVALEHLRTTHAVRLLDVRLLSGNEAIAEEEKFPLADLYLLKSHAQQALDLAHSLEERGAFVVNSWASTLACQDRELMAERMHAAHLPWPRTWSFPALADLLANQDLLAALPFPLIVKSHYSHRGDLVAKVHTIQQLWDLAAEWSEEPIVLQEFVAGDGWDIKLWVIDQQLFAARRRTPLEANASKEDFPMAAEELPNEWTSIAREIGRVFNLRLYGVDLLITERGPMIVDVNSFPGFRGVPGADGALVTLIERLTQERQPGRVAPVEQNKPRNLSIQELPSIVTLLFERARRRQAQGPFSTATPVPIDFEGQVGLFVRYLRRKPGRGLAVIYAVDDMQRKNKVRISNPSSSVSLTLDESALQGAHIHFSAAQAQSAPLEIEPSGVLYAQELGLSVQAFPADNGLPTLAASCDTAAHSPLFEALQAAARTQAGDKAWQLISASAEPVRYKPANRCVIRYSLILERSGVGAEPVQRNLTIFGKVYADPGQAHSVQDVVSQLYDEQIADQGNNRLGQDLPFLPRPLGMIEAIGLTFNEAVQPANAEERLRTGTRALQPQVVKGRGGEITDVIVPEEELRLAANALARLHTSNVRPHERAPRSGAKEAKRARDRASLLGTANSMQAADIKRLAEELAARLEILEPDTYRPAHGGFKSSQLLFHSHQVFVVDFDGLCFADPALDVGYFLAYLRPSGLWYARPGMRQWFEAASKAFVSAYSQAMLERGTEQEAINGILERSRLYEAALLFKIATRRVNRLNSPRPKELAAMLNEIAACLVNR